MMKSGLLSIAVAVAGLAIAATGCGSAGASATSAPAAVAATVRPATTVPASARPSAKSAPAALSANDPAVHPAAGPYLAESQDIMLVRFYKPACRSGCLISGDSTAALYNMTWRSWGRVAVGRGSYHLDGCEPNCATGKIYEVPAIVKLEKPVKACYKGIRYFYSRAVFAFPKGLPKALRGANAPENPWTFTSVIDQAKQSCRK
jgi:hypothetical protein